VVGFEVVYFTIVTPWKLSIMKLPPMLYTVELENFSICFPESENSRLVTVLQENTMLRSEVDMLRLKCKHLLEENRRLKQASIVLLW